MPRDLALLLDAVHEAGAVAMEFFRGDFQHWEKPDGAGPVTEADLAVNAALKARLLAARPDYGWLSEEDEDDPERLAAGRVFVVDPIDGTRAFLDGQEGFSVSVAVVADGRPTAGAVFLPAKKVTYAAAAGQGAVRGDARIAVSRRAKLGGAQVLASAKHLNGEHWQGAALPVARHFRPSLAWRLCLVAEGRFDALITLRDAHEWDIAAGALIAAEAGAVLTDRAGKALRFNSQEARTAGVIAAPPALHRALMARR